MLNCCNNQINKLKRKATKHKNGKNYHRDMILQRELYYSFTATEMIVSSELGVPFMKLMKHKLLDLLFGHREETTVVIGFFELG